MPSPQHVEVKRLRWAGRAAGLGRPGDGLLRQHMLLCFELFSSLLSPYEGQVPHRDLPRSPRWSWWAPGWVPTPRDISSRELGPRATLCHAGQSLPSSVSPWQYHVGAEGTLRTVPGRSDSPQHCMATAGHFHQLRNVAEIKHYCTLTPAGGVQASCFSLLGWHCQMRENRGQLPPRAP